jgi:hypothetical protein
LHHPLDFTVETPSSSFKISDHVLSGFAVGVGNTFDRAAQVEGELLNEIDRFCSVLVRHFSSCLFGIVGGDVLRRARWSQPLARGTWFVSDAEICNGM